MLTSKTDVSQKRWHHVPNLHIATVATHTEHAPQTYKQRKTTGVFILAPTVSLWRVSTAGCDTVRFAKVRYGLRYHRQKWAWAGLSRTRFALVFSTPPLWYWCCVRVFSANWRHAHTSSVLVFRSVVGGKHGRKAVVAVALKHNHNTVLRWSYLPLKKKPFNGPHIQPYRPLLAWHAHVSIVIVLAQHGGWRYFLKQDWCGQECFWVIFLPEIPVNINLRPHQKTTPFGSGPKWSTAVFFLAASLPANLQGPHIKHTLHIEYAHTSEPIKINFTHR